MQGVYRAASWCKHEQACAASETSLYLCTVLALVCVGCVFTNNASGESSTRGQPQQHVFEPWWCLAGCSPSWDRVRGITALLCSALPGSQASAIWTGGTTRSLREAPPGLCCTSWWPALGKRKAQRLSSNRYAAHVRGDMWCSLPAAIQLLFSATPAFNMHWLEQAILPMSSTS